MHHFVSVLPLTVGQQECLGSRLLKIVEHLRQSRILLDVLGQVLTGLGLQTTLDMNIVHCSSDILKQRFNQLDVSIICANQSESSNYLETEICMITTLSLTHT